jgi:hypothetical protein
LSHRRQQKICWSCNLWNPNNSDGTSKGTQHLVEKSTFGKVISTDIFFVNMEAEQEKNTTKISYNT